MNHTRPTREQVLAMCETVLAEKSLHFFVQQAWHVVEPEIKFADNWHIKAICDHLEALLDGRIKPQLIANVPPGTSKSLITSVFFPAWVWTTQPHKRFMTASYAEVLSMRDAIRTRDLIQSEWYQRRWPVKLKEDQNTKTRFDNDKGGWRIVASVTGRGIGEHPDIFVADDIHNVLQAESEADRMTVIRWFEGVFCVRGAVRDAKRVLIMQRLHALDCSGLAIDKGGWELLCLPMEYEVDHPTATIKERPTALGFYDPRTEDGELLWPKVYTREKLENLKINMGLYGTAGQMQQRPSPRGGGMFHREWFEILPACPALGRLVRYFDKAGTEGGTGAESAGALIGEYEDSSVGIEAMRTKYIILDIIHGRWGAAEREAIIKQTAEADRARWGWVENWNEQEPGSGGKESAEHTIANLVGFDAKTERVTDPKNVRANPLASQASVGKVKLLAGVWNSQFLQEAELFPMGKLKDFVDACAGAFSKLWQPGGGIGSASEIRMGRRQVFEGAE